MTRPRLKTVKKLAAGRCLLCGEPGAELLDAHRALVPGAAGGTYTWANTLPACPSCHRKLHLGYIQVLGRHLGTSGKHYWRVVEGGAERFLEDA